MEIGFDIIGDLFLSPDDEFNWEGKPTSLYCIVTGNVSNDIGKLQKTLEHLSQYYKGIFYVSGTYEFENCSDVHDRIHTINHICTRINNVAGLWHHVVLLENIAILGCNGWSTHNTTTPDQKKVYKHLHNEDILYLKNSVKKLQKHGEINQIVMISNSVPNKNLYFGQIPSDYNTDLNLDYCIKEDTENKIKHWTFGNYTKPVDITFDDIRYVNNPYIKDMPYWPKRIGLEI